MTTDQAVRFSMQEVLDATRKVVKGKEDFVYDSSEGCSYGDGHGQPSCLVGHVIHALAPDEFERLLEVENRHGTDSAAALTVRGLYLAEDFWDRQTARVMQDAQSTQDNGSPWGSALDSAVATAQDFRPGQF